MPDSSIHPTAEVSAQAFLGENCKVWHQAQIREGARLGEECIVGKGVYIDVDVIIGARCKLQNGCQVYRGVRLADGVFIGPGAILTNDKYPRASNGDGRLKTANDWQAGGILVNQGASIGAGAIILPGVTIGEFAMVGAGAVVTRDVPGGGLVGGTPARLLGWVDKEGSVLKYVE